MLGDIERYKSRLVLRPQEISNHPEVIRRLGLITINTALECDIYGNVNSTHVGGTHMMNGIGGSGDFARNAHLSVFVTKAAAKGGDLEHRADGLPCGPHRARHRHHRHRARPGRPAWPPAGAGGRSSTTVPTRSTATCRDYFLAPAAAAATRRTCCRRPLPGICASRTPARCWSASSPEAVPA